MSVQIEKKVLKEKNQLNDFKPNDTTTSKKDDKNDVEKKAKKEKNVFTYMESTFNYFLKANS